MKIQEFKNGDIVEIKCGAYGQQYCVIEQNGTSVKVEWWDENDKRKETRIDASRLVKA